MSLVNRSKEGDSLADQNGQDRIANFVDDTCFHACASQFASAYDPDVLESGLELPFEEVPEVTRVEFHCRSRLGVYAARQDVDGFVAI